MTDITFFRKHEANLIVKAEYLFQYLCKGERSLKQSENLYTANLSEWCYSEEWTYWFDNTNKIAVNIEDKSLKIPFRP